MGAPAALGTQYSIRLDQSQGAQNVAANTSVVNWAAYAIKNSGSGYFSSTATSWSGNIGGVGVSGSLGSYNFSGVSSILIASGSVTVTHDPDGTKTASSSFTWNANNAPQLAPGTAYDSLSLTRIPRGPQVEVDGAWSQSLVNVEFDGAWATGLMYVEFDGAWVLAA